ncbi:3-dehydroquinate synthase [Thermobispora bispora]|jgi:3-dehydroquinate synthase|uniref:3-dehydroquinate synthase n=1 Tax=Thermobispora bispora (strain ATCC 19993 / DSM 43833 / CBS 139.67 / JCM 10125 / KCTC 9307 / NBRC 14880 / R51) TaxID=469371 RepID=D6Y343_THEBD|nr:3-dehydroquinate synthase [Thermobispora bispora]MBO2473486.1 3-dehydroquinate synthase [Actinomycetales bacterium]MDI9579890.1 3-dehydroquinate synthase [Thermobispora sp.]ADG88918.1 3-dehydroquinate synthase [Thermobispora bispora DSM 43833]MBX6168300.1 3-dehydroquinate synthase [Thermobispora bispora]QSI48662.1 3-dehydroquinate synthase [Thermobispora bispora]
MSVTRITVKGERPYDVVVGTGIAGELPGMLGPGVRTVAVIHPAGLPGLARPACAALEEAGYHVVPLPVPDGEQAKTIEVAAGLWSELGRHGVTRSDAIVGVGGGATTDLAGFVAATWLRGVRVALVPTTLLAMVDAAVGGKTGINTPEGKNLVGAFHPPVGVLCDLAALETVPREDYVAGLAEIIKGGFIADPEILRLIESDPAGAVTPHGAHTRELIERKIRVKAEVVGADLRESGLREILNYGHTLGHAIERAEDYRIRHGEAVAIGLVYAAELARLDGRAGRDLVDRTRSILESVGLPTTYRRDAWPAVREHMRVDKKARGATLRFVVLDGIAKASRLENPPEELLEAAYREVAR